MGCASKKFDQAKTAIAEILKLMDELMVIRQEIAKEENKTKYNKLLAAWNIDYMSVVKQHDAAWDMYWEYAPNEVIAENEAWKAELRL